MINWHRLFGIFLTDYFTDTPYEIELEKDLSLQQQFLDVVILRKNNGEFEGRLPDGLDNLTTHNLLSYKSKHESFDAWAVQELISYYVNYRKQIAEVLPDEAEFSLYAVSTRFPQGLKKSVDFKELQQGVYELDLSIKIRLIVLSKIAKAEHNTIWHLFSHVLDKVSYAAKHYHSKIDLSSAVNSLYEHYNLEGLVMPYTVEDFRKDYLVDHVDCLSVEQRSKFIHQFPTDELLGELSLEERLKGLSEEEVAAYFAKFKKTHY